MPPPPVETGIPWLGFVVYPTHRQVKGRKLRHSHRRLRARLGVNLCLAERGLTQRRNDAT